MSGIIPASELKQRMNSFCQIMNLHNPDWEMAVIFSKINLYYFTGTMPDGMLIIERNNGSILWARRSFERTMEESQFGEIKPMNSYREAAQYFIELPKVVYLETEFVPLAMFSRFQKYFGFESFKPCDFQIAATRSVKSLWELNYIEQAGAIHQRVLEERVPELLHEGMSEADLAGELYRVMIQEGHQGIARFGMLDTEIIVAQLGFGENSLYPTNFDGPGGNRGLNAAVPSLGSRHHKLKKGDLVFVDMGLGVNGYHTDKTMTYMFGAPLSNKAQKTHQQCVDIQNRVAELLKPGNIPENIYETIMGSLSPEVLLPI